MAFLAEHFFHLVQNDQVNLQSKQFSIPQIKIIRIQTSSYFTGLANGTGWLYGNQSSHIEHCKNAVVITGNIYVKHQILYK